MGHFAKVVDGKVTQVIVAEKEFFDTFVDSSPGQWLRTMCIVTVNAAPDLEYVHDRMPVVLEKDEWATWLDGDAPQDELERLMLGPQMVKS